MSRYHRLPDHLHIMSDGAWIGEKHVPWARYEAENRDEYRIRRLHIPFENGLALSVIWGSMTYSDNHQHPFEMETFIEEPELVEVGVLGPNGILRDGEGNQAIYGMCTISQVHELMFVVSSLPSSPGKKVSALTPTAEDW